MASLRRPSQAMSMSRPSQSSSQHPMPVPSPDRRRDVRKSKVGEKIKKRMSMRYAGPEQVMAAPPPMPGNRNFLGTDPYQTTLTVASPVGQGDDDDLPFEDTGESKFGQFGSPEFAQSGFGQVSSIGGGGSGGGGGGGGGDEQIRRRGAADMTREEEWNLDELHKENVDVAAFVRNTLKGADEEEKRRFKAALMRQKQAVERDLQRNVFKNYAEFVIICKEISTLENDMLELKDLLNEWKSVPQLMGMDATLAPTLDKNGNLERRRTLRNSIADLQQMYKSQLTNLWSTVEGSQKYLPLVPGRHLVYETHNFVELNAATYKAKQSVSLFLLSDLLLIAGRRRMKTAASGYANEDKERERGRMVAERCWVLADLVVIDVKDSGDLTNALKIKRGKEVCVYRTAKPEDKKSLLNAFRQVSQELSEKKRKDNEKEQERRKSMWQGEVVHSHSAAAAAAELLSPGRRLSTISTSLTETKDLQWIDEFGDDLTMAIATRSWEEAVKIIEKGYDLLKTYEDTPSARELINVRINSLKPTLVSQIAHDLSSLDLRKTTTARLANLLARLDCAILARDTFLKARKELMLKRIRAIKHEGDVSIYISELAIVCFTIIRHTSDWFTNAFKDNRMASGFVTWAKEQIETFADKFRRQVYAPSVDAKTADECLRVAASHNRKLLRDVGLDFTFLLSSLLQSDPTQSDQPHPSFNISATAPTPAPGYHIEPSPYVPYVPDTPAPDLSLRDGSTAPLSVTPLTPRRHTPRVSDASSVTRSPGSPAPPPRSERRAKPPPRMSMESKAAQHDDSLT